jgi:hypothetical protein
MADSIINRLRSDGKIADALEFVLGTGIDHKKTQAIRCLNPAAHKNGDRNPSMLTQPDAGGVACRACSLALGLLGIAVYRNLAADEAAAAKLLEERFYPATIAYTNGNGHHPKNDEPWPFFPRAAEALGWTIFDDHGVTSIRCPTFLADGSTGRVKIRRKKTIDRDTATFEPSSLPIGLLAFNVFLDCTDSATQPTVVLLAGETDLLAWTAATRKEGIEAFGLSLATGETAKIPAEHASRLRGCRVVVLYDNDDVGRKEGPKRAAEALAAGAVSSVSIHVPDPHKDVCDFVRAGGTARQLLQIADDAGKPPAPPANEWDLALVIHEPAPEAPDELVERLITRPSVNIVFGPPSSGKSWGVMQTVLDAVLGGGPFLGNPDISTMPNRDDVGTPLDRALWVFGSEDTSRRVQLRLRIMLESMGRAASTIPEGAFVYATIPPELALATPDGWKWLDDIVARRKPTVLVLDTIASLTGETIDASKAEQVVPFMRRLHALRDTSSLTIFGLHHTRKQGQDAKKAQAAKADAMLGSQAWRSMADSVLMLDAQDGDTSSVQVRLVKSKDIDNPAPGFFVSLQNGLFRFDRWADEDAEPAFSAPKPGKRSKVQPESILMLLEDHPEGLPWNQLHTHLKIARSVWYAHRDRAFRDLGGKVVLIAGTAKLAKSA